MIPRLVGKGPHLTDIRRIAASHVYFIAFRDAILSLDIGSVPKHRGFATDAASRSRAIDTFEELTGFTNAATAREL